MNKMLKKSVFFLLLLSSQLAMANCYPQLSMFDNPKLSSKGYGLLVDKESNKMWLDCRLASSSNVDCASDEAKISWYDLELHLAEISKKGLLGYKDWRLPTIKELLNVISRKCYLVDFSERRFVSEIPASYYWVDKPYVLDSKIGFDIRNNHSYTLIGYYPYIKRYVHLVRDQ